MPVVPARDVGRQLRVLHERADAAVPRPGARLSGRLCGLSVGAPGRPGAAAARRVRRSTAGRTTAACSKTRCSGSALKNTLIFTAVTVGSEIVLAVMIALLINQTRRLDLARHALPDPAALRHSADRNGLIWSFLYSFQFGFLNRILFTAGLIDDPINWAGNPDTALYAVTVPYIWRTLPFAIILVHAALQGIPRELYEQAAIDGANAWHRFRHITLPMLQQIIAIILILRTAFAFAVFEEILAITQGGPGDATWVAAWYSYKITFSPPNNFGMGSASAFILTLMIARHRAGLSALHLSPGDALMFKTTPTVQAAAARRQPDGDLLHPAAAGGGVHRQHPVGKGAAGRHATPAAARVHASTISPSSSPRASRRAASSSRSPTCPTTSRTSTPPS